jgi:hypothetical protein
VDIGRKTNPRKKRCFWYFLLHVNWKRLVDFDSLIQFPVIQLAFPWCLFLSVRIVPLCNVHCYLKLFQGMVLIQSTPRDIKRKLFIYKYVHIVPFSSTLTSSITDHWLWNYVSVPKIMSMLALILPTITEKLGN